jgi:hypothetical protein
MSIEASIWMDKTVQAAVVHPDADLQGGVLGWSIGPMTLLKNVLVGLAIVASVAAGIWQSNWSPLNLLFGPQYLARSQPVGDSRSRFVQETAPRLYPILVQSLQARGTETVVWTSQSGESRKLVLTLTGQSLLIETAVFTGSSALEASTSATRTIVQMFDADLDGRMDSIRYVDPSGGIHAFQAPFDETSQYLWDSALAITFRFGKCCR